jgi:hypothetical protein
MLADQGAIGIEKQHRAVERAAIALDDADDQVGADFASRIAEAVDGRSGYIYGAIPVAAEQLAALGRARADPGPEIEPARVARDERLGEDDQARPPAGCLMGQDVDYCQRFLPFERDRRRLHDSDVDRLHRCDRCSLDEPDAPEKLAARVCRTTGQSSLARGVGL